MTREEAIRELMFAKREVIADSFIDKAYDMAISALKAQEVCGDVVSRQTLQKELALYPIDDVTSEDEAGYNRAITDVQKMVLHLPSAQPEVIRCNDCKYWDRTWKGERWGEDGYYCSIVDGVRGSGFYCADAERKTE